MDKRSSLSLKLTHKKPVREIYVESEAKSPDASITNINQLINFSQLNEVNTFSQLQELGIYDAYFERKRENGDKINSPLKLKREEFNAIEFAIPADVLNDLTDRGEILELASVQTKNDETMQAIEWKRNGLNSYLNYATKRLKKDVQQFDRLEEKLYTGSSLIIQAKLCLSSTAC